MGAADARFSITSTVSEDDLAVEYRAVRDSDHRPVLLKVLRPTADWTAGSRELRNELETAAQLSSSSVLRPLALDTYQGRPALVREDFLGRPLVRLLGEPFGVHRFLDLAVNITAALAQVHRAGFVHKNVTPRSILVRPNTDEVRLSDFGLASRAPPQPQAGHPPELIEGTLPFMSPEQTGRINRQVDSRSDLYSLGVTFFMMLTGRLPFSASDPLEWVHAHVARAAPSVDAWVPDIPPLVAHIVGRLLEKMPEERYQTARGLEHDLERARNALVNAGHIQPFPLGELDVADRLRIPQCLYGREKEQAALRQLLAETAQSGRPALSLISGYAGVGKSALVHELLRSIETTQGFFLAGKFDQLQQNIPYSTFTQAFRQALQDLQAAGEERRAEWRARLSAALGTSGSLIAEVIPETEELLGPQPPVASLPPLQAEDRFRRVFHAFITAFGRSGHPLVLFLDDLQWADSASLKLLRYILTLPDTHDILVFGAYRDNEAGGSHPLRATIDEIREAGVRVEVVALDALRVDDVASLTRDAVQRPIAEVRPLAQLLYTKTGGNPFFIAQLLTQLVGDELLSFDGERWRWDLDRIQEKGYSDDVARFMVGRVARVPPKARDALRLAACVGNSASVQILAAISSVDEASLERDLVPCVEEGLLFRGRNTYQFAHDRVQQAAYSLVPAEERPSIHLRIGRHLLQTYSPEGTESHLFEIVNQLDQGRSLVFPEERQQLAELNLRAGRKATATAAYDTAAGYLTTGLELLPPKAWESCYELAFSLHLGLARCDFLAGRATAAQDRLQSLRGRARRPREEAILAAAEVHLLTVLGRLEQAFEVARASLSRRGFDLPGRPAWSDVVRKYEVVRERLAERSFQDLIGLPAAEDPEVRALMDLTIALMPAALFSDENRFALLALTALELSMCYGLTDGTASACVSLAMVLAHRMGKHQEAADVGRLGRAIVDRRHMTAYRSKVYLDYALIGQWMHPLRDNREILRRSFDWAIQDGSLPIACYSLNNTISLLLSLGTPLPDVQREGEEHLRFARRAKYGLVDAILTSQLRLVANLRGKTSHFSTFDGDGFSEGAFVTRLEEQADANAIAICWHSIRKLQARFFSGDYEQAWSASLRAEPLLWTSRAFMEVPEHHLFTALTAAALHDLRPPGDRPALLATVRATRDRFRLWAELCPANFEHKRELVDAELCRLEGDEAAALRHFEAAIRAARDEGFVQNEALACELAARLCRHAGLTTAAAHYMTDAKRRYLSWGADGKVMQLERLYPDLEARIEVQAEPVSASSVQMDLIAMAKMSQAISMELSWDGVTRRLLEVALQQGCAGRACLLLKQNGDIIVAAQARADEQGLKTHLVASPLSEAKLAPRSIVEHVCHTGERLMLDDPTTCQPYSRDPYIQQHKPRSLLCLAIVSQLGVAGALYLENELASCTFPPERVAALEFIARQAAVALANSRLFSSLQRENAERARAERERDHLLLDERGARSAAERAVGLRDEFLSVASHELRTPLMSLELAIHGLERRLGADTSPSIQRNMALCFRQLRRMDRLVGLLLDVSRIQAGRLDLDPQPIDLGDLVRDAAGQLAEDLARAGTRLVLHAERPVLGQWDASRVEQVVINLLTNAIKFGSGRPVEVSVTADEHTARLAVTDHGIGISEAVQAHLFERFSRGVSSRNYGGLGLGLYIVRTIVEAHGGRVSVASTVGEGSTFLVELPLSPRVPEHEIRPGEDAYPSPG